LGPQHLPFKSGAARIAVEAWRSGIPLTVVPLGITYDAPSTFRSSVEVIVGNALTAEQSAEIPEEEQIAEAKKTISKALQNVGINTESVEHFQELRMIARMAAPGGCYFQAMKLCEEGIPERLQALWSQLREAVRTASNLKQSEAASTFAASAPWISLIAGGLLVPFVAAAAALNFLPLAGACWAGRRFPDAPNVITLWRILIGVPLSFLWFVIVFAGVTVAGKPAWFLLFIVLTLIGWLAYQAMRQCLIAGWNGIRFPKLRRQYLEFQELLLQESGKHEF
jgi:hypothetical protein